ncbi:MAG TPA: integration host factor subunit alpha [Deltaproteobacteria bacterium]|nr:integration host factor subunit alpha [Deltaproteobacteria bacterium]
MPNTLTKAEIIEAIRKENGYSLKQSVEVIEILLKIIKQILESGEDVMISGFGKFQVKYKRERRGRNPTTNKDLILPPRRMVTFKCSGKLRDRIKICDVHNESYIK